MADRVAPYGLSALVTGQTTSKTVSIQDIRAKYPQYEDMSDADLANALHTKFYGDLPFDDFAKRIGLATGNSEAHGMAPEAADVLTMGLQPKINAMGGAAIDAAVGAVTGDQTGFWENYTRRLDEQRANQVAYEDENPVKARVAQAGGLAAGITALPEVAVMKGPGLASKLVNAASTGFTYGGVAGAAQDADTIEDRLKNAAYGGVGGAVLGPVAALAAKGIGKTASMLKGGKTSPAAPSIEQIRDAKTQAYDAAKQSGLVLKPDAFNDTADKIVSKFADDAVDADLQPKAAILMKRLQEAKDKPLSLSDLENLRKKAVRIAQGPEKDEAHFASKLIEGVDDFIDNLTPASVTSGDPQQAGALIKNARELAKRQRKSEVIETALSKAENAVGANYTQAGWQTAVQQQFRRIADNEKLMRLYNPDEVRMIKAVVSGAKGQVLLNIIRKFNPANAFALVGATMNPALGVPALAVGQMAKAGSARMTGNAVRAADEMIRNGGPLALPPPNSLGDALQNPLAQIAGRFAGEYGPRLRGR